METSSLFIPQDVINVIVDDIATDYQDPCCVRETHSLYTCALICRAFHARATHHIFSKVQILQQSARDEENLRLKERIFCFLGLLQHNPAISASVRTLVIHVAHGPNGILSDLYYRNSVDGSDLHAEEIAPMVDFLGCFPALQRFVLRKGSDLSASQSMISYSTKKIYWQDIHHAAATALRALFTSPSLIDLKLSDIWQLPIETLRDACQIKQLTLGHNLSFKPTKSDQFGNIYQHTLHSNAELSKNYWLEDILSAACVLDSADIDMHTSSSFRPCSYAAKATPQVLSRLRSLRLTIIYDFHIEPAWALIRYAAETLKNLNLEISLYGHSENVWTSPLPSLCALRHLHVICHVDHDMCIPAYLISLFNLQNSTSNLETIHITNDWSLADRLMPFVDLGQFLEKVDVALSDKGFCRLKEVKLLQIAEDPVAPTAHTPVTALGEPNTVHDLDLARYLPRLSALKLVS